MENIENERVQNHSDGSLRGKKKKTSNYPELGFPSFTNLRKTINTLI